MLGLQNKFILIVVSTISIAYGVFELLLGIEDIWWSVQYLHHPAGDTTSNFLYSISRTIFFGLILPVAAIWGGMGLLRQEKWGWVLEITLCLVILILSCAGAVIFLMERYYGDIPGTPRAEDAMIVYYSAILTFIKAFVSFAFILFLIQKPVKMHFLGLDRRT